MPAKALKSDRYTSNEPQYARQMNIRASVLERTSRPAKQEGDEGHGLQPVKPRCVEWEEVPRFCDSRAAAHRHRDADPESEQRGHRSVSEREHERTISIVGASKEETQREHDKADHDPNRGKKKDASEHLIRRCANS